MSIYNFLLALIVNSDIIKRKTERNLISTWYQFTKSNISFLGIFLKLAIAVDHSCFLTFQYKFHGSLSILHGTTSSSSQLRLDGGMGGEEPFILLSFCLYQVNIIIVKWSHTDSPVISSRTVAVCSSFVLLCTPLLLVLFVFHMKN